MTDASTSMGGAIVLGLVVILAIPWVLGFCVGLLFGLNGMCAVFVGGQVAGISLLTWCIVGLRMGRR